MTCDDFLRAMADGNGAELDALAFGTRRPARRCCVPSCATTRRRGACTCASRQHPPPTPGQSDKQPLPIPVRMMLYAADGEPHPLRLAGEAPTTATQRVLVLREAQTEYVFEDIDIRPVASLLQDFSAPVRLEFSVR